MRRFTELHSRTTIVLFCLTALLFASCGANQFEAAAIPTPHPSSVEQPIPDQIPKPPSPEPRVPTRPIPTAVPQRYREIVDPTGTIRLMVPEHWTSEQGAPFGETTELIAATDAAQFLTGWGSDGVAISATEVTGQVDWRSAMYETSASGDCRLEESKPFSSELLTGWIDSYRDCEGNSAAYVVGATNQAQNTEILVEIHFVATADNSAATSERAQILERILDSLVVR